MKAIETEYAGVRFRSRLEARWAVFFDALGIRWEYEPEGFELSDGTRYLPDFWLPTFDGGVWVEIKPYGDGFEKARRFARETSRPMWLCDGEPGYRVTYVVDGACGGHPDDETCDGFVGDAHRPCSRAVDAAVLPNADQAEGENRFFWLPGYEQSDGSIAEADRHMLGGSFAFALQVVRGHRFWSPRSDEAR